MDTPQICASSLPFPPLFSPLSKPLSLSICFHPLAGLYVTLSKFTHFSMEVLQDLEWYELYQEENTNRLWQLRIICSHRHQNKQFLVGSLASGILEAIGIKSAKGRKLNSPSQGCLNLRILTVSTSETPFMLCLTLAGNGVQFQLCVMACKLIID